MSIFIDVLGVFSLIICTVNLIIAFMDKKYYDMVELIIIIAFISYILQACLLN